MKVNYINEKMSIVIHAILTQFVCNGLTIPRAFERRAMAASAIFVARPEVRLPSRIRLATVA